MATTATPITTGLKLGSAVPSSAISEGMTK
jgi:hypothetical protein